jgi:hypothetical protein
MAVIAVSDCSTVCRVIGRNQCRGARRRFAGVGGPVRFDDLQIGSRSCVLDSARATIHDLSRWTT